MCQTRDQPRADPALALAVARKAVLWKERIIKRAIPSKERDFVRRRFAWLRALTVRVRPRAALVSWCHALASSRRNLRSRRVLEPSKSAQLGESCLSPE